MMESYERPEVLASYAVEELVEEAVVCMAYGPYPYPAPNKHDK